MKPAKKKPVKKSTKTKSSGTRPHKRKATAKKTIETEKGSNPIATGRLQTESGEIKKIKTENLLLRNQLEQKDRELEIEAALEKVRAVAMGMNKPDDLLKICEVLFIELTKLRFNHLRCALIHIFKDEKGYFDDYDYSDFTGGKISTVPYKGNKVIEDFLKRIRKSKDSFAEVVVNGKALADFLIFRKKSGQVHDKRLLKANEINYYFFSIGIGNIGISNFGKISNEQLQLLKRFRNVFNLAYQRYTDIAKAEAQAREAQIEAALERVRAQTMAMHSSDDVGKCIVKMFGELTALGVDDGTRFGIGILNHENENNQLWTAKKVGEEVKMHIGNLDMASHPLLKSARKAWKAQVPFHKYVLEGKDLLDYYHMLNAAPDYKIQIPIKKLPKREIQHCFIFEHGFFYAFSPREFQLELIEIIQRFSSQFAQTYRRYLDLVKAEAQAREAEIELTLERVRAKSMAMHHTEELKEVIQVVYEQLVQLKIPVEHAGFIIDYKERDDMHIWLADQQQGVPTEITIPYFDSPHWNSFRVAKAKGENFFANLLPFEVKNKFYQDLFKRIPTLTKTAQKAILKKPALAISTVLLDNVGLYIEHYAETPFTIEENTILMRFGKVFQQTYTRFLDLQKAEAQAREAQIEVALEKVRSRSLAMHKPEELKEVASVLRNEMGLLGVEELETSSIYILDDAGTNAQCWYAIKDVRTSNGKLEIDHMILDLNETEVGRTMLSFYHSGEKQISILMQGENRKEWINYCATKSTLLKGYYGGEIPERTYHLLKFSSGYMGAASPGAISSESWNLLQRVTAVFSFAYTRFLDLQKAEAQAREAEIQLALERVRARTMAMQKSEELAEAAALMFQQVKGLGIETYASGFNIWDSEHKNLVSWMSNPRGALNPPFVMPIHSYIQHKRVYNSWKSNDLFLEDDLNGSALARHYKFLRSFPLLDEAFTKSEEAGIETTSRQVHNNAHFSNGYLLFITNEHSSQYHDIFIRFAKVFEQTYTRFLDLQKAEAQAREAKIEAALERVRSKTMAMHKSEQLPETAQVLFEQFAELGKIPDRIAIGIVREETQLIEWWATDQSGSQLTSHFDSSTLEPTIAQYFAAWKEGKDELVIELTGTALNEWIAFVRDEVKMPIDESKMQGRRVHHAAFFTQGLLLISAHEQMPAETVKLLVRFAKVFSQTYTRFLDLQKAEAQAREATIEAALERVRGRAMAMHNSNDLIATAGVLFAEMRKLGINAFRCGVGLLTKENRKAKLYSATTTGLTENLPVVGWALLEGHEVLTSMYEHWVRNEDYFPVLKGDLLKTYYEKINSTFTVPVEQTELYEQHGYFLAFSEGMFYSWSEQPFTPAEVKILQRFKTIVGLTFRRYLELQRAESNALEAVRSASLDRVRAEIASMRSKQDLERITPLIWKELTTLGIPFVRCGVFIMDEQGEQIHTFLSTPDGKAIAAFQFPYGSTPLAGSIEFWREKKMYLTHWGIKEYAEFADAFIDKNESEKRAHYLSSVPKGGIHLHLLPFMQGMLYVGNTSSLTDDNLHLIQSVADAFSTAYARYEDFTKIESAKEQIEKTLIDLKQTQTQLIQSEKMASLGELTAGIAHEIQNPLNFVNNFSEVSNELIKEIQDIRRKTHHVGTKSDEDELLKDIEQNLEKINHHGKRAADIVKGMLQHSRSSSGQKELTDINTLCDEYLRLAYHGLRAKDKSFNAKFETDFDSSIPKINIVPQDIGRVILNLINNAFYAVNERQKLLAASHELLAKYEPTVSLSTKKEGNKVLIAVKDNGNGIPDSIKEKIFQPFFTTKPTGQGTGLGLSLSYDIVKAHGGELSVRTPLEKVDTKEGKGSEFVISIPV